MVNRDPSECLRVAIYELDSEGIPWIVAEKDDTIPDDVKDPILGYPYSCRFCGFRSFRDQFIINHLYDHHLNRLHRIDHANI